MNINYKFPSCNYSTREGTVNFIVIHYTELSFIEALDRLREPAAKVSAHYLIKEDGEIFNLVDTQFTAWHAGVSYWQGFEKLNEYSIGIELDNLGTTNFSQIQMVACKNLCLNLMNKYNITASNVIGHSDIAPQRKIDPGIFFDWAYLAEYKIGIWHDREISERLLDFHVLFEFDDKGIKISNLQNHLKRLGYKIEVSGVIDHQTNCVIRAFQSHFYPEKLLKLDIGFYRDPDSKYSWDNVSDAILNNLIKNIT